jgi:PAS domain S-box-containing protein
LLGGFPAVALAVGLLWFGDFSPRTQWTLTILVAGIWLACAAIVREHVVRPLQTVSNVLAALRERDYTLRARGSNPEDALGLLLLELNSLGEDLRAQRLGALEASALLRRVMEEIDVAIFAFDAAHALRLVNRSGAALLGRAPEQLLGRDASSLGLAESLSGDAPRVDALSFPGRAGRWEVRRGTFRQGGLPHQLLVLTDVSRALSDEERQAWKRLVRVLSHELNNSLAPIKSIADSLLALLSREPEPTDRREDLRKGLGVIASRSESLSRLMAAYARLARLPPPRLERVAIQDWVRRVVALETRRPVAIRPGPNLTIQADGGQLDQLLINLVRNAVDATLEGNGAVVVGWEKRNGQLDVWVRDEGAGLADTANLFVPFYTTKPDGSGIGLALSRQIAEAHGGTLTLSNQVAGPGCEARLTLPVD